MVSIREAHLLAGDTLLDLAMNEGDTLLDLVLYIGEGLRLLLGEGLLELVLLMGLRLLLREADGLLVLKKKIIQYNKRARSNASLALINFVYPFNRFSSLLCPF